MRPFQNTVKVPQKNLEFTGVFFAFFFEKKICGSNEIINILAVDSIDCLFQYFLLFYSFHTSNYIYISWSHFKNLLWQYHLRFQFLDFKRSIYKEKKSRQCQICLVLYELIGRHRRPLANNSPFQPSFAAAPAALKDI